MATPKLDILLKCVQLLHRESELGESAIDNSKGLIKTILTLYKDTTNKLIIGGENNVMEDLKHLVNEMVNNPENYAKETLINALELILKDRPDYYRIIEKQINTEMSEGGIKRSILSLRGHLRTFYNEQEVMRELNKASYTMNRGLEDKPLKEFVEDLVTKLETLTLATKAKDPGIMDELDFADAENSAAVIGRVKNIHEEGGRLITGWKELNDMTQSGFRRGETVMINALQHKYKSGFTQSLFAQMSLHNKPELYDKTKKPLNVLFSFEDDAEIISEFLYRYLYFNENDTLPDIKNTTAEEISRYIKEKLSVNGFHVKIYRINPSEWTYKHMFNKILELEAMGYEIVSVFADYLAKLPTTGCTNSGVIGSDVRDMFNRCRNFFSSYSYRTAA